MEKNRKRYKKKTNELTKEVINGYKIAPIDLSMQIFPLIKDYFNGIFLKNTKGILMKMENGQIFQLTVFEVAK